MRSCAMPWDASTSSKVTKFPPQDETRNTYIKWSKRLYWPHRISSLYSLPPFCWKKNTSTVPNMYETKVHANDYETEQVACFKQHLALRFSSWWGPQTALDIDFEWRRWIVNFEEYQRKWGLKKTGEIWLERLCGRCCASWTSWRWK